MPVHYGYIRRTESAADGDHVDVFVGPDPESPAVFVIDQQKPNGRFDEHKVMIGFLSEKDAIDAYKASYSSDWQGLRCVTAMTVEQFGNWLNDGDTGSPIEGQVSKYSQKEFDWNESEHPRNSLGEFVEKKAKPPRPGYVAMRQAKAGGETSEVTGKFYKGGHWMPVHGLHSGKEKPESEQGELKSQSPVANENARPPMSRQLSPEQIAEQSERQETAERWKQIHAGPLGHVLSLGDKPHRIKFGHGVLQRYVDTARAMDNPNEKFKQVADVARAIVKEHLPGSDDDYEYLESSIVQNANDDVGYSPITTRKFLKDNPNVLIARRWIEEALEQNQSIDTLARINDAFSA